MASCLEWTTLVPAVLRSTDLPFVLGEIGRFRVGVKRRSDLVIREQQQVPALVSNTACVSSAGLNHLGDLSHFDTVSLRKLGHRYASAMRRLRAEH